jgi:hypothetical protein
VGFAKRRPFLLDVSFDAIYSEHFLECKSAADLMRVLSGAEAWRLSADCAAYLDKVVADYQKGFPVPDLQKTFRETYGDAFLTRAG